MGKKHPNEAPAQVNDERHLSQTEQPQIRLQ